MTVRSPVYVDGNNDLKEMSPTEVLQWTKQICYLYSTSPSVTLAIVTTPPGNLGAISDTRTLAGATATSNTGYPPETTTAEPGSFTVTYDKVSKTNASVSPTADTGKTWPVYVDSGNLRAMNLDDIKDTFLHPAIDLLIASEESATTAGTYTVTTTATPAANYTLISSTPIFVDTRANTNEYSADGIPEALDQLEIITSYYLHRRNGVDTAPSKYPVFITSTNDIQVYTEATIDNLFKEWIRETASESPNTHKITYTIESSAGSPAGITRGTAMVNTKLDGDGAYTRAETTYSGGVFAYRAQEFPNGSAVTIGSPYNLRINKV